MLQVMKKTAPAKKKPESPARMKSPYELLRDSKIARNQKRLFELGLEKTLFHGSRKENNCMSKSRSRKKRNSSKGGNDPSSPVSVSDNDFDSEEDDSSRGVESEKEEISEEIEKILDYKCTSKGAKKLQIQWSTGDVEWAKYQDVEQDCATLVADFMKNHENKEEPSRANCIFETSHSASYKQCEHDKYEIGVTYMPEEQVGYLQPNHELHGVKCSLCLKGFVPTEPLADKEIKPSTKKPMYTCSNRATAMKCLHSVCYHCIMSKIKTQESTMDKRPSRSRRSVQSEIRS